jgi:hypothetical protein
MVSEWVAHNAWMLDHEVGDEPPHVNLNEIAPTVIAEPEHLAALMRFSVNLEEACAEACDEACDMYNSDEYKGTAVYPDTDLASVCYMDPAVAACDGTDTYAPKWVVRFAVCEPSSDLSSEPSSDLSSKPSSGPEEPEDEYEYDEFEDSLPITGCDTLPPACKQRKTA